MFEYATNPQDRALAPVVQKLDNAVHRIIDHYPLDNSIGFPSTYPLDSDLSGGWRYPTFTQLRPVLYREYSRQCRGLFPFRKRSLPFLTVDATIGNQAFSHDCCNIFPGLSYNKANNTFLNSLRKDENKRPTLNLRLKLWKGLGSPVIDVTVKKDSLLVYRKSSIKPPSLISPPFQRRNLISPPSLLPPPLSPPPQILILHKKIND